MKKSIKSRIAMACFVLAFIPMAAFSQDKAKPWPVPADFKTKANPVKSSATSIADGKEAYDAKCASCHGKKGMGDGPKSKTLDTASGDFTTPLFHAQTDGDLFYKTKTGRDDMPSYKSKLSDEEIWATVNYIRTFKK
jgi:mono/diheme cytochrome c family protein